MENIAIPQQIIENLKKDILQNCNILYFAEDNPITNYFVEGNSVLIKGTSDREWIYISSKDKNEFNALLNKLSGDILNFAVVEDWQIPIIKNKFSIKIELTTIKYYLPEEIKIKPYTPGIIPLSPEDAEYIHYNSVYREFTPVDYIKERITKGTGCGLLENNKLAAWAITHDDGAMGFLHVLDEYRGKGYAKNIMNYMISKVREKGRIPFAQIEEDNFRSIGLVTKFGFKECNRVTWLSRLT